MSLERSQYTNDVYIIGMFIELSTIFRHNAGWSPFSRILLLVFLTRMKIQLANKRSAVPPWTIYTTIIVDTVMLAIACVIAVGKEQSDCRLKLGKP